MLFLISILYLAYRIGTSLIKKRHFNSKRKPRLFGGIFLIFAAIIYVILIFIPLIGEIEQKQNIAVYEIFILIPFTIIVVGIFLLGVLDILGFLIIKFENQFRKAYEWLKEIPEIKEKFSTGLTFVFLILIGLVIKFGMIDLHPYYSNFKRSITIPENLANKSLLDRRIKNDFELKNNPSLIYFNDKYLFYKMEVEKKEKILVLDFNEIITSIPASNNGSSPIDGSVR